MRQFLLLMFILGVFGFVDKTVIGDDENVTMTTAASKLFLSTEQPSEGDSMPEKRSIIDVATGENVEWTAGAEHNTEHDASKKSFWGFCVAKWEQFYAWRLFWFTMGFIITVSLFCICCCCILCAVHCPRRNDDGRQNGGRISEGRNDNQNRNVNPEQADAGDFALQPLLSDRQRPVAANVEVPEEEAQELVNQDPPEPDAVPEADAPPAHGDDLDIQQTTPEAHL